jgi:chromosomal replication initiation ATPase DnaA
MSRARQIVMPVPFPPRQLAFALGHHTSFAREDFLEGPSNSAALAMVERWPDWPDRLLVVVGPEGSGKSHLAAIWAEVAGARFLAARALGETNLPRALSTGALVIENVVPDAVDERALFHLVNLAREQGAFLLATASAAPSGWALKVPDLASRLRALPVVELLPPDDVLLRAVLVKLFADRQLGVDESLLTYLLKRIDRSFAAAREAVERLDREGLRLRRPVTRALAAEALRASEP